MDVGDPLLVLVEEIVFFRNPHFEKRCIQVIRYLYKPQLFEDLVHVLQGEQADQNYKSDVKKI